MLAAAVAETLLRVLFAQAAGVALSDATRERLARIAVPPGHSVIQDSVVAARAGRWSEVVQWESRLADSEGGARPHAWNALLACRAAGDSAGVRAWCARLRAQVRYQGHGLAELAAADRLERGSNPASPRPSGR